MKSKVLPCTCKHDQQDKLHGQSARVHNYGVKKKIWRCTVCKSEKDSSRPGY